ncbi:histidine phosphatase family protein [Vibrio sp. SCSIO 43137]|uniref:histidine phosphatase family protein n=1 Tax=Vibrio sp. SCSIO 43137 TaxID=3021011 RepID=UPI002307EC89|nr:histidine phosphatase family protein [Vibrio sp. SCSIO 43137]WCE32482.1 histidine phosphatase family protein [Vibrio sp. SCSIO 43137]
MASTRITLLRHGLPEGDNCFRGHTDFAITDKGLQQMRRSVEPLCNFEVVVSSPLSRCADFAAEYANEHQLPLQLEPGWMEINFGDWDGEEKDTVWQHSQQTLSRFWDDPWNTTPPNAEPLIDYDKRINAAWGQLLEQHKGKSVLLVTHGGVIKQVMRQIMQMPENEKYLHRLNIPYAALVAISVYHDENGKQWPRLEWPVAD